MLTAERIGELVQPYLGPSELDRVDWPVVYGQLAVYLELILKWNARTNLTAIREPEEMVQRHFGESLFVGRYLGNCATLLDFGSGAGFPGVPIQLMRPEVRVTLAESQGKKASFLREAVRELGLSTEVWAGRAEAMPVGRQFDVVAMRAVDKMEDALREGAGRARKRMLVLGTNGVEVPGFQEVERVGVPGLADGLLWVGER